MAKDKEHDPVWQAAWTWVRRQHERGGLDDAARGELARWLAADPVHRKTHGEAARLWLLVGLVPPANDVPSPGDIAGR
jgi:ferric-dicitrate binding protein FerR (iron transport regulator)